MNLISETDYEREMKKEVLPYLEARKESGDFERVPGEKIHYRIYTADSPRADLVLVHGFSEGIDKFNEVVYYFLKEGFQVWQIQQRGHGKSYRGVSDPSLVYIKDYRDLVEDLAFFVREIVNRKRKNPDLPKYLFGHSMGGGVSAVFLEKYPEEFEKAVLSSPMLELDTGKFPVWVLFLFLKGKILLGKGKEYLPGSGPYRPEPDFSNSCSDCRARYDYWFYQTVEKPEYQTCAPALETSLQLHKITRFAVNAKNCARVKAQVLLLQAGRDHMVKAGGQETFIRLIGGKGRIVCLKQAKHELYLSTDAELKEYWKEIFGFLG